METPPIVRYPEILTMADNEVDQIIEGILHIGTKMVLGGGSKCKKTWLLIDIALCVTHGVPWMGHKTNPFKALYINLEIPAQFFAKRLKAVAKARGLDGKTPQAELHVWSLRGYIMPYAEMVAFIIEKIKDDGYGLIIIDPIYKLLGTADENKATDVTNMLNSLERISCETGAAVLFAAHFSKGNQSLKEHIDRISGSGVFARDPDTISSVTHHEEGDCYSFEFTVRNFPDPASFVIEWSYPVMQPRTDLNPKKLKQAKGGRDPIYDADDLLGIIPKQGIKCMDWLKEAETLFGISSATFHKLRRDMADKGSVYQDGKLWFANGVEVLDGSSN